MFNDRGSDVIFSSYCNSNMIESYVTYRAEVKTLCYIQYIGAGVETLSYTDIGVNTLCYI